MKADMTLCLIQTKHQASVFFIETGKTSMEVLTKGVSFFKI